MIDEKEQAWLRLKCFEIVVSAYPVADEESDDNYKQHAEKLYRWATTGERG